MNQIISFHQVKGGQGCTVTAAAVAVMTASAGHDTLLVDCAGDLAPTLGCPFPDPGTILDVNDRLSLITVDTDGVLPTHLFDTYGQVIIDAGHRLDVNPSGTRLLVIRPEYVTLARLVRTDPDVPFTGMVMVNEPGRALRTVDCERAAGLPVVAETMADPMVARTIDAGLLATRIPHALTVALEPLVKVTV